MIIFRFRQGLGFDISFTEDRIYRVGGVDDKGEDIDGVVGFIGVTLSLPFCEIMWGEFIEMDDLEFKV